MSTFLFEKHYNLSMFIAGILLGVALLYTNSARGISVTTPELPIQVGEVTSVMILDGTIVDADVSATAGIASTKITEAGGYNFITTSTQTISGVKTFSVLPEVPTSTPTGGQVVSRTYLDSRPSSISATSTAGEDINTNDALFIADRTFIGSSEVSNTGANAPQPCGYNQVTQSGGDGSGCTMGFRTTSSISITYLIANIGKVGSPNGNTILYIAPDDSSAPSSTMLASSTFTNASLSGAGTILNFALQSPFTTVASTTYWIVATSTGTADNSNYPQIAGVATAYDHPRAAIRQNSSWVTWTANAGLQFGFGVGIGIGDAGRASANTTSTSFGFVGFAQATTTRGNTVTINAGGVQGGFSGLSPGRRYYLSNTTGTISVATGTVETHVGKAINAQSLLINTDW